MKVCYVPKRFTKGHRATIDRANEILEEYSAQGFVLTLRQLYYQFVARGYIPNDMRSYKRLGGIIGEARLAGLIDWTHIEDRSRGLTSTTHFDGPQDALNRLAGWYQIDLWENQKWRPEVWIEKDALSGVIAGVCNENDIPYFSCRGYASLSEMWRASLRLRRHMDNGQTPYIIHFGDHDPSGIDMSRDITTRLQRTFMAPCEFKRVALNVDQVEEYNPPPNPAKVTDSRYDAYVAKYGDESWELDALDPPKFRELIESQLNGLRDEAQWDKDVQEQEQTTGQLREVAAEWETIGKNKLLLKRANRELAGLRADLEAVTAERDKLKKGKRKKPDA